MEYRVDKHYNKLSILGLGCMRFPRHMGITDMKASEELILSAIDRGINYFDTAYIYPGSEEVLGTVLKNNNLREKVFIATKLPLVYINNEKDFDKFFNIQLKRLQTDYIDYYLMHMITDMDQWNRLRDLGIESWIKEKMDNGKIRQIGFSFHGKQQEFMKIIDSYSWDFTLIQYNYMNVNYQAGRAGLLHAYEKGVAVMIMEPLLGGKLAVSLPKRAQTIFKNAKPDASFASWALRWLWNQKEVTLLLSGMSSLEQLNDNCSIANSAYTDMLNEEELMAIDKVVTIFNEQVKIPCTGCNYCMPCPKGVNIPASFLSYNVYHSLGKIEGLKQYAMSLGIANFKKNRIKNCVNCGLCATKCPQKIDIVKELHVVQKKLEPFYVSAILKTAGRVLNKGNKTIKVDKR